MTPSVIQKLLVRSQLLNSIHLRSFCATAKLGSLTNASHHLSIAQSRVSPHIRSLEKELSTALLDRIRRPVRQTHPSEWTKYATDNDTLEITSQPAIFMEFIGIWYIPDAYIY